MDILHEIRAICARAAFQEEIVDLLQRLCAIDTCPGPDLARLRENEGRAFEVIRAALEALRLAGAAIALKEVSPAIQSHPAFSAPYYATGSVAEVYQGRGNLLYLLDREPSPAGVNAALNAHIDTVAPYFPPVRAGDFMAGRGTADDKGNVAVIVGALHVLAELERRGIVRLKNKLTAMFVIDEETGGNGSLDLASDRKLKERYDSILVMECTGNRLHPANRGAVFVRCEGRLVDANDRRSGHALPAGGVCPGHPCAVGRRGSHPPGERSPAVPASPGADVHRHPGAVRRASLGDLWRGGVHAGFSCRGWRRGAYGMQRSMLSAGSAAARSRCGASPPKAAPFATRRRRDSHLEVVAGPLRVEPCFPRQSHPPKR